MSIRERKWTSGGEEKTAWVVDYFDQNGKRHIKTFKKKKEAKDFEAGTHIEVKGKIHVADRDTVTVAAAGKLWHAACVGAGLEITTTRQYEQHLRLHINPLIGHLRLNEMTVPKVRQFLDDLQTNGRSPAVQRAVRVSLGALLSDAQERGLVVRNPVKEMGRGKARARSAARHEEPVVVGVDLPFPDEIRMVMPTLTGKIRVFWMTAIFTGMRASELRGLRWQDVDFQRAEINVSQRANILKTMGPPKTKAGRRTIPLVAHLVTALKDWKKECPKGDPDLGLVFPTGIGTVEEHNNIITRWYQPQWIAAGITKQSGKTDRDGQPITEAKYTGLHALRHFYASWCINSPADGGLGLSAKVVQDRMGHSSIQVTLDTYSHLFRQAGTGETMDSAAAALLG
ncbi:site-specific integrase [Neorhizobium sp. JUb45]|uniref:tyrosine-type recombinase/integrase n=1 Tax=Neorhizobium sp. JUb45 TaxID=2485113 RepID=UPI00105395C4|nr:site-specific integrase [Neorhizobium sp. JUb45]TCR04056.1 integrase-like protein [Neorhizobium sp. JUb45]